MFNFKCLLIILLIVNCYGQLQIKFDVFSSSELKIHVPSYNGLKLVTFRIGIKRIGNKLEDLEYGENNIINNQILINDNKLNLQRGDIINYLLIFKNDVNYQIKTGKYVFNGDYLNSTHRRQRKRRAIKLDSNSNNTELENNSDYSESEEFDPSQSRFGGGHHRRNHWNRHRSQHEYPRFGPHYPFFSDAFRYYQPSFPLYRPWPCHGPPPPPYQGPHMFPPHHHGPPPFHHGPPPPHHGPPPPRPHNGPYYHGPPRYNPCEETSQENGGGDNGEGDLSNKGKTDEMTTVGKATTATTTTTTTTTNVPDIDIRFGD